MNIVHCQPFSQRLFDVPIICVNRHWVWKNKDFIILLLFSSFNLINNNFTHSQINRGLQDIPDFKGLRAVRNNDEQVLLALTPFC